MRHRGWCNGRMTTASLFRIVPVLLVASGAFSAQPMSPASSAGNQAADQAWAALDAQRSIAAGAKVTKIKGPVAASRDEAIKVKQERVARAQSFRATAQAAKEFHTHYPQHPKAAEARRVEALAAIEAITPHDKAYERTALAAAAAYRADPILPIADRIQVAHAMECVSLKRKLPGSPWFTNPVLAEQMIDRLHAEFGEQPAIWGQYLALAQNTYCDAGKDVAHRIVQSPYAPDFTKVAARRILERYALVRRPIDFALTPTTGRPTTLAQLAGKTTVVCLWDGSRYPEGPPGLQEHKKNPRPNTKWVYISLGQLGALPKGRRAALAPLGTTCVEVLGWNSPIAAMLRIDRLPCVYVLDDQTRLSGFGRIDELSSLLAGIGRPALP